MELTYTMQDGYLIPNLKAPDPPKVGKYGMLRHSYLRKHKKVHYQGMLLTSTLNSHLEQVDKEANEMMETLVATMAKEQGVTEKMKAENQMQWVGLMNNIRAAAEEVVLKELIYS